MHDINEDNRILHRAALANRETRQLSHRSEELYVQATAAYTSFCQQIEMVRLAVNNLRAPGC